MTEDDSRDDDDGRDDETTGSTDINIGLGGLLGSVGDIIEALSELEDARDGPASERETVDRDSFTIDYNYDVNVGIGGDRKRRSESSDDRSEPERTVDVDDQDDALDHAVDVREYDDEVIVSADLPGVDEDDLDIAIEDDASTLRITAGEDVIERIPIDSQLSITDVSFTNQILQIRLQASEDSNDER